VLRDGYWRLSPFSTDVAHCAGANSTSPCLGGGHSGTCADGYVGHLCDTCTNASTYFDEGACRDCPGTAGRLTIAAVLLLVGVACAGAIWRAYQRPPALLKSCSHFMHRVADIMQLVGGGTKRKHAALVELSTVARSFLRVQC
jgi:hypothetical protein